MYGLTPAEIHRMTFSELDAFVAGREDAFRRELETKAWGLSMILSAIGGKRVRPESLLKQPKERDDLSDDEQLPQIEVDLETPDGLVDPINSLAEFQSRMRAADAVRQDRKWNASPEADRWRNMIAEVLGSED